MNIHTIGIDLGKTSFHLVGLSDSGEVVVRKHFSRAQLLRFTANRTVHRIGMEACGGSHFLGRAHGGTHICEDCLCKVHALFYSRRPSRLLASRRGSTRLRPELTATWPA